VRVLPVVNDLRVAQPYVLTTIIRNGNNITPPPACPMTIIHNQRGFTLIELLVSTVITTVVLGGALMMSQQVQKASATRSRIRPASRKAATRSNGSAT
jgi:prepilin-type N-terminal cleavage/methylation domain-containing protein